MFGGKSQQSRYCGKVYTKCLNVIALVGNYPGALAMVFCVLFVQHTKQKGNSKAEALRLFDKLWERVGSSGELLQSPEPNILDG